MCCSNAKGGVRSCMRDGGIRPSEVCLQGPASNQPQRHWLKVLVVSMGEKALEKRQVWIEKANTREPSFKCRKLLRRHQNRVVMLTREKSIGSLLTGWAVSGIEMARAQSGLSCGTAGTCVCDVKGEDQEGISRPRVPKRTAGADRPVVVRKDL